MPVPTTIVLAEGGDEYGGVDEVSRLIGDNANAADAHFKRMAAVQENGRGDRSNIKPMDHLVSSRRRNICWSLSLLIVFLGSIGSLAIWRFRQGTAGGSQFGGYKGRAEHALQILNKHYHSQSKRLTEGCEGTVLLMRHCEKYGPLVKDEDGNQHCSYIGKERAHHLATLFGSVEEIQSTSKSARWPYPSYLFALSADRRSYWNFRQYETLHPLSKSLNPPLDVTMTDPSELPVQIFDLLQSGAMCGRLAVISWKHSYLPDLATALGCGPDQGCPTVYPYDSFDQLWQLKYVWTPSKTFREEDASEEKTIQTNHNNNSTYVNDDGVSSIDSDDETSDDGYDTDDDSGGDRRLLLRHSHDRKLKKSHKPKRNDGEGWFVYASVQHQRFDPLSFSASVGDYDVGGLATAGRWKDDEI